MAKNRVEWLGNKFTNGGLNVRPDPTAIMICIVLKRLSF